jgi:hypothetical protein
MRDRRFASKDTFDRSILVIGGVHCRMPPRYEIIPYCKLCRNLREHLNILLDCGSWQRKATIKFIGFESPFKSYLEWEY